MKSKLSGREGTHLFVRQPAPTLGASSTFANATLVRKVPVQVNVHLLFAYLGVEEAKAALLALEPEATVEERSGVGSWPARTFEVSKRNATGRSGRRT